jgi:PEP-CTERM motif
MKSVLRAMLVWVVLGLGYATAANAALLFENYAPGSIGAPGTFMPVRGTEFTVGDTALSVTKLGTFARASSDMMVGIWRVSDQTLVGSAEVPSVGGTMMQGWNFASIAQPFTLLANTVYRIGAQTELNTVAWGGSYQLGSGIASVTSGNVYSDIPGFAYPSASDNVRLFSANAEIAPIPEPSSFALLALGLAAIWIARRRLA